VKLLALLLAAVIPQAPISISARLQNNSAHVTVRFAADLSEVSVKVRGEDGLKVSSDPSPVSGRSVQRGERIAFDVDYRPGPDQSTLTVEVSGKRGEERVSESQSFTTGTPDDAQRERNRERSRR
jgi:hypothetical protein